MNLVVAFHSNVKFDTELVSTIILSMKRNKALVVIMSFTVLEMLLIASYLVVVLVTFVQ